jgi:hypothetical protein
MKITLNKEINGEQLKEELQAVGIDLKNLPELEDGFLILHVNVKDETKTKTVYEKHLAEDWSIKKIAARQAVLDKLGLTTEDMATLLG